VFVCFGYLAGDLLAFTVGSVASQSGVIFSVDIDPPCQVQVKLVPRRNNLYKGGLYTDTDYYETATLGFDFAVG
jgi:hypothetical protein